MVRALCNLLMRTYVEEYINQNKLGFGKPKIPMSFTFLCPGDVIYDVRSHDNILKFAEVEDIIMDILNPSKTQI